VAFALHDRLAIAEYELAVQTCVRQDVDKP
jgi:hypothetical protein